jgi:NhaP-type Na+/H+ or K+/H+ antiporter
VTSQLSSDDVLLGLGLVLVLAVTAQLLARRLRLPAIVVLLPTCFLAGVATDDVHPDQLLGQLYQPFVSIAVGVILFEAGLRLSFAEVAPGLHKVVARLVLGGVLVTWLCVAGTVVLLFNGLDTGVSFLIGAVLVVSGPTVVLPLLAFTRPTRNVRTLLRWEGVLVDPVGALLGVLVFHAVRSGAHASSWHPGTMLVSIGIGALVAAAAAALLWFLLPQLQRLAPRQAVPATLMAVVAAVVAADLLRDDSGFVAATLMGAFLANQRRIDLWLTAEFQESLVQLLVGVLFVLISASVTPSAVKAVLPEALALVAVMALVIRPAVVALATWRSNLTRRERIFAAWMAPRGIVAGATASAFGLQLANEGIQGANRILPIVFVAIFGTVVLYGLTAAPLARALGLAGEDRELVLLIGGHDWARSLAAALRQAGVRVRLWVGREQDREAARAAGLEADRGRMIVDAVSREAELEEVTTALLLTPSDDFNAVVAAELRRDLGHPHVYRVAPDPEAPDLVPPPGEAGIFVGERLTFTELSRRFAEGARVITGTAVGEDALPLFAVARDGGVSVATDGRRPAVRPGDTVIALTAGELIATRPSRRSGEDAAAEPAPRS